MEILLKAIPPLILQPALFLCLGSALLRIRKRDTLRLSSAMLLGYFVYYSLFEALCLFFELRLMSLHALSICTAVLMAVILAAGILYGRKDWAHWLSSLGGRLKSHGFGFWILLAVTAASVLIVLLYTDASADSDYYVGMASTALFTDTLGRFDPTSGAALPVFKARYALCCFPYHSAVMVDLFRLPVIVQARSVTSAVNVLMANIAVYRLGRVLFTGHARQLGKVRSIGNSPETLSRRAADLFVLAVFLVNLFSSTIYLPGIFLFTRAYEGKALIANICLPCVFGICVCYMRGNHDSRLFRNLFWISFAGVCFSASSVFLFVLSACGILPVLLFRRRWKDLPLFVFACLPVILWAGVYYMTQHGMLYLSAVRG